MCWATVQMSTAKCCPNVVSRTPVFVRLGLESQNKTEKHTPQHQANACHKGSVFLVSWGRPGQSVARFKKNKTIQCSSYLCVLLFQSDIRNGEACEPVCMRDVPLPPSIPLLHPPCRGHRLAFGVRQAVRGAFPRKTRRRVGLGADTHWQWCAMKWQDESRILRALNLKWFFFP